VAVSDDFDQCQFGLVLRLAQQAAHQLEAQKDEESIDDIGLTVIANFRNATFLPGAPDRRTVHAQFAGKAHQPRQLVERGTAARLVHGQQVIRSRWRMW
jgi:hypothetical protein